MCGIVGIIGLNELPVDKENILTMADEIKHRGPDGEGFLITNNLDFCNSIKRIRNNALVISKNHHQQVAFGHRRLSIIDLHFEASQPMSDSSDRYWIVYNGEIYNHAELRRQLENLGHNFKTDHSDTEVILNAYAQWGKECLSRFNGMWAFCIWDSVENTFFLARDLIGKKPLYYVEHDSVFYFASELKALLVNQEIPRILNERAVYDYLTYTMVPSPDTIFRNVKKLPAAHYLFFKPGEQIVAKRYWNPFRNDKYLNSSETEIIEALREKISEAVRIRLLADVEVGILLSGGLDSSINLACASKYRERPIKAFCVGFENMPGYKNEFCYARQIAALFKADYYELQLKEKDYFDFLQDMVYYQDEPNADAANIPLYYVSKLARSKGVKVLLGGEGSDEMFIGYQLWDIARQFSNIMEGKPLLSGITGFLHKNSPLKNKRTYYHGWYEKVRKKQPVFWSGTEQWTEKEKQRMLSSEFLHTIGSYNSFFPINDLYSSSLAGGSGESFDWMSSADLVNRLPDLLLARLDRMTMAASVEGRNPFLDVNLIEYVMKIPPHLKIKNKEEKYILKKAYEGILPAEIIYRRKDSFSVPLDQIFSNRDNKQGSIETIERFNLKTNIFSSNYIKQLKESKNGEELLTISSLAYWYEKFN